MAQRSTYVVTLDELEAGVHVPVASLIESQQESDVPHDLPFEDMALGRALGSNG